MAWVTNAFNYLFGIANECEIKHLANNVNLLNKKDLAIAHRFNGTSQLLNSTTEATKENRLTIRSLSQAVQTLTVAYTTTIASIRGDMNELHLSSKLSELTTNIMRTTQAV